MTQTALSLTLMILNLPFIEYEQAGVRLSRLRPADLRLHSCAFLSFSTSRHFWRDSSLATLLNALLNFIFRDAKSLVKHLLVADVTKRYGCLRNGANDIKNHRWFKNLDWFKLG